MRKTVLALAVIGAVSGSAQAATTLATGPAPAWIKPVMVPTPDAATGDAAIRVLLQDQQADLEPGRMTRYAETVLRVQTPQGLSAGNAAIAWNPDTETATIHKLLIRRGATAIDVLASGQRFTIARRESNLENAVLDGVLTATIQPEGVQVGDVIDFAFSVTRSDPALGRHVENIAGGWNGVPIDRAHLLMRWPADVPVKLRGTTGLPAPEIVRTGGRASVELSLDALPPLPVPKGAPPRYGIVRLVEASDFASWRDLAAVMAPLYAKAAMLAPAGFVAKEADAIAARSADPKARAEAALALVQDRVRYVFLGMNDGGLVPADAETTWSRRFGDCKGKTVLLLALLGRLGIAADPVMVSIGGGDGLDERLPMVSLFNHVLVRVTIAKRVYWLDGTRTGDIALDRIVTPNFEWGLPLVADATLIRMTAPQPDRPQFETAIRIDASAGITVPAPIHVETVLRDDAGVALNRQIANLAPDVRDRALRDYWRGRYDFVDVKAVAASFDAGAREERLVLDGAATMDWSSGWYEADGVGLGYKADFVRDPGPGRDAPFAVAYPYSSRTTETILLPPGAFTVDHGGPVDVTVAGMAYHRDTTLAGRRFLVEETERAIAPEFPAAAAPAAQVTLRDLASKAVYLAKPATPPTTAKDLDSAMATLPTTADGFVDRGDMLLDHARFDEAIADYTRALALDPRNAWAHADRGIAAIWKGDIAAATPDLDTAQAIDPRNAAVYRGHAMLAERRGAISEAIAGYTRALEIVPGNTFDLSQRAGAYRLMGDTGHALADAAEAIRRQPTMTGMYLLRANLLRGQGDADAALREAAAVAAANPDSGLAHVVAARIYAKFARQADAAREFDAALKIQPEAYVYINRSETRRADDIAARQADLDAAAKLEPRSTGLFAARATLDEDRLAYSDAVAAWTASLELAPTDATALVSRGIDRSRLGDTAFAEQDFTAARASAKDAETLNMLCWTKAKAGVALVRARDECKAALALAPGLPQLLDSLALVELRLGDLDAATMVYRDALAKAPGQATSLYGLALIQSRSGKTAEADANRKAAIKADPDVADNFRRYGLAS